MIDLLGIFSEFLQAILVLLLFWRVEALEAIADDQKKSTSRDEEPQ